MTLPTNRTTANTAAEHVADHNTLHAEYNVPTHTHSGAYVPVADSQLWVPAMMFRLDFGSATLTQIKHFPAWSLADAGAAIHGAFQVPHWWNTFTVDMWWTNRVATAGDVHFDIRVSDVLVDGGTIALASGRLNTPVTAPAEEVVEVTEITTGLAHTANAIANTYVSRNGGAAGDTLAGAAGFLGLMLRRET